MLDLTTFNTKEVTGRVYLGSVTEESRSKMKFFYLNHDESEFERWDAELLQADGKFGLSLTYDIKEFMISYTVSKTRNHALYVARFSNMKRKTLEDGNLVTVRISLEKSETEGYVSIKEYDMEVKWEKGKPLHDIWIVFADAVLEDYLDIKNVAEAPLLEGRLTKN